MVSTPMKTVGFRATEATIEQVAQLAKILSVELGIKMSRSQTLAFAVKEALERRKEKTAHNLAGAASS